MMYLIQSMVLGRDSTSDTKCHYDKIPITWIPQLNKICSSVYSSSQWPVHDTFFWNIKGLYLYAHVDAVKTKEIYAKSIHKSP